MTVVDWIYCFSVLYFLGPSFIFMHGFIGERCVRFSYELLVSRGMRDLCILEHWSLFLPRFVSWHDIFNAVSGSAWTTLTYLDQVSGLNTYIGCRRLSRPGFVTGPKSRTASNIKIVHFDIDRTCIQTNCENGYTGRTNDVTFIIPINVFYFTSLFISDFWWCKTKPLAGSASRLRSTKKHCLKRVSYLTVCNDSGYCES